MNRPMKYTPHEWRLVRLDPIHGHPIWELQRKSSRPWHRKGWRPYERYRLLDEAFDQYQAKVNGPYRTTVLATSTDGPELA